MVPLTSIVLSVVTSASRVRVAPFAALFQLVTAVAKSVYSVVVPPTVTLATVGSGAGISSNSAVTVTGLFGMVNEYCEPSVTVVSETSPAEIDTN